MAKYLVMECNELGDQWECDVNMQPLCITDDKERFWELGYEIYEIYSDGSLELIKPYNEAKEVGFALYFWEEDENPELDAPTVIEKMSNYGDVPDIILKSWIEQAHFYGSFDEIKKDIERCGGYSEIVGNRYYVIGTYADDKFDCGY